jgi:hypothetical protein
MLCFYFTYLEYFALHAFLLIGTIENLVTNNDSINGNRLLHRCNCVINASFSCVEKDQKYFCHVHNTKNRQGSWVGAKTPYDFVGAVAVHCVYSIPGNK